MIQRIGLVIIGLLFGMCFQWRAAAQSTITVDPATNYGHFIAEPDGGYPHYDLTVKDVIEVLADFDIKHVDQQPFFMPAYGVTNFDQYPPAIWIFNQGDLTGKYQTVLHELTHVHFRKIGVEVPEAHVGAEEQRLFQKIFGTTP